jgi:hypothetical protein
VRSLGYRIEGHCSVCRWKFRGRIEKTCEWCFQPKLIHAFLLTIIDPDERDRHEAKDDPKPKKRRRR